MPATKKWAMYIDGYNFYYAIKKNPQTTPIYLSWCDFGALAGEIIRSRGSLIAIKYFTAPVENFGAPGGEEGGERNRQRVWLDAVSTISNLEVVEGFHTGPDSAEPYRRQKERDEKETDVNIAIRLVLGAATKFYDSAILITSDHDQIPAVRAVSEESKYIEVWLPPGRPKGRRWAEFDGNRFVSIHEITKEMLERSRLPDSIKLPDGTIQAPRMWRSPSFR